MIGKVLNYVIERFQTDNMVNTITLSDELVVDTKKENIYPLVAINFQSRDKIEEDDLFRYNFRIHVLQQRDIRKEVKPSKLMEDNNWLDNLNECENIINNFVNFIERIEIDANINIDNLSPLDPLSNYGGAGLDGYSFEVSLSYPNTGFCND